MQTISLWCTTLSFPYWGLYSPAAEDPQGGGAAAIQGSRRTGSHSDCKPQSFDETITNCDSMSVWWTPGRCAWPTASAHHHPLLITGLMKTFPTYSIKTMTRCVFQKTNVCTPTHTFLPETFEWGERIKVGLNTTTVLWKSMTSFRFFFCLFVTFVIKLQSVRLV